MCFLLNALHARFILLVYCIRYLVLYFVFLIIFVLYNLQLLVMLHFYNLHVRLICVIKHLLTYLLTRLLACLLLLYTGATVPSAITSADVDWFSNIFHRETW